MRISPRALAVATSDGVDLTGLEGSGGHGRVQLQDVQRAGLAPLVPGEPVDNSVNLAEYDSVHATDVAKRVAQREGIDLSDVEGSGRGGRIRVSDLAIVTSVPPDGVSAAATVATASALSSQVVPFSTMRKQIARRLTKSYQSIPHYYLQSDVFVDSLMSARAVFNAGAAIKTSINDWLIRAVALTLVEHPDVNIHVGEEQVTQFANANVAVAVAVEGGLMTPVLKQAQNLSIATISNNVRSLATRARDGALTGDDVNDATFTISNLGMFGVSRFTALINPPQGAILAVGAARPTPTERDGKLVFAPQITLTLSCDHRAIDGATGGRFLQDLTARLEAPEQLL